MPFTTMRMTSLASLAAMAAAVATGGTVAHAASKRVTAQRLSGTIRIDGTLGEAAWSTAPRTGGFWQRAPNEGADAGFNTEFQLLYDDDALYVAVRAFDPQPSAIKGLLTRRDQHSSSDWIFVGIDSYHDKRTAFVVGLNPAGVQRDYLVYDDSRQDDSWDAVWEGAARTNASGWTVEFRIPFNQLRFSPADKHTWGLQVRRQVERTQEESVWSPWPKEHNRIVSLFGTLEGVSGIRQPRRLEVSPYAVAGASLQRVAKGDPYRRSLDTTGGLGLDVEYGITSNLTLSGTINPDFGQVEADPSEVNLSAQETFIREKRPFFLEGADIFRFSLAQGDGDGSVEQLFYSRRIGAMPHGTYDALGAADFVDVPGVTTIYGAAKISGKTRGGWSIGVLDAVTAKESARLTQDDGSESTMLVEPLTNYAVLRLRKDWNDGRSNVGAAVTAVNRRLEGDQLDWLHDQAYAGGVAVSHRFGRDLWSADARLAGSWVHGSAAAIDLTQRASQRYLQRPDAKHLDYDSTRTSLAGMALLWSVTKDAGGHWRYGGGGDTRSPGFEVNDLGFQRGADRYVQWLWAQYRDDRPGKVFRSFAVNVNPWLTTDWAPTVLGSGGNVNVNATWLNYWGGYAGINVQKNRWSTGALRGGPAVRQDLAYNSWLGASSDSRKSVRGNLSGNAYHNPTSASYAVSVNPSVSVQARSNLDLSVGPSLSLRREENQYVTEATDIAGAPRYLLARIRQTTVAMTLRLNYTFSPKLSFQLYAQPFASAGRYDRFKEADAPGAERYADRYHVFSSAELTRMGSAIGVDRDAAGGDEFSFESPDFRFRQLNSNLVARWEYRPGSSLFVIWSHGRTSSSPDGRFSFGDDTAELAREPGEHVFLVKLNYWLGV